MSKFLKVDGDRIRRQRLDANFKSQRAFADQSGISYATYRRAEGGQATQHTLDLIASFHRTPAAAYLNDPPDVTISDLRGEWIALYLETALDSTPYRVWEKLTLTQDGTNINGTYSLLKSENPFGDGRDSDFEMRGRVIDNFVHGEFFVPGRTKAMGVGSFNLKLLYENRWAEGFCSLVGDAETVEMSHNVWVRKYCRNSDALLGRAEDALLKNCLYAALPRG